MFGHADNQQQTDNNFVQAQPATDGAYSNNQVFNDVSGANGGVVQTPSSPFSETPSQTPGSASDSSPFSVTSSPVVPSSTSDDTSATDDITASDVDTDDATTTAPVDHSELLGIKQQALQQLSPLVSHLDQTPEDRFKTTMMMIQASDDHALLPDAYKAAQAITDEKAKAQALLDVVNEINYFTQGQ